MFLQKVKKTGTPSNNPVRPKSLDLHTSCMHVSAFVSVCFVCGIPDDALSYIFCMTVKFNPALCVTECRSLVRELLFDYSPEYISELLFCQDIFFTLFPCQLLPYQRPFQRQFCSGHIDLRVVCLQPPLGALCGFLRPVQVDLIRPLCDLRHH